MESNDKLVRRLRKKLQQIENLELLGRPLNDEELCKVGKKDQFRTELAKLVKRQQQTEVASAAGETHESRRSFNADGENPELKQLVGTEIKRSTEESSVAAPERIKKPRSKDETKASEEIVEESCKRRFPFGTSSFWLHNFYGHNDVVTSVVVDKTHLVSTSRDTTIKVWNLRDAKEPTTLRGHTNFVSSVVLVPPESLTHFSQRKPDEESQLLISASLDCCIKVWDIGSGETLRSIYTFNGVTSLEHVPQTSCCIIGTEGGKLEIYDLNSESSSPVWSATAFSEAVSCLRVRGSRVYSASLDGTIVVWELLDVPGKVSARPVYRTEDVSCARPVRCMTVSASGDVIYYGGEGSNIKVLHWRTGTVEKLANHLNGPGITNAITSSEHFLVSSSFDVGSGIASVNVRGSQDRKYAFSLNPGEANRILSIAVFEDPSEDIFCIATGGTELCVWEAKNPSGRIQSKDPRTASPVCLEKLSFPAEDTEVSDESESDTEVEDFGQENGADQSEDAPDKSKSWCTIV